MFRGPDYTKKVQEELKISKFFWNNSSKIVYKAQNRNGLNINPQQKQKENIEEIPMKNKNNLNLVDIALYNIEELDVSLSSWI